LKYQDICLLAVHYRNREQTLKFLEQVSKAGISVWIADNSFALEPLEFEAENVHILPCPENPGYFGGIHRLWQNLETKPRICIVSNTDLELDPSFFDALHNLEWPAQTAVIAPKILSEISGEDINPMYPERPSYRKMKRLDRIFKTYLGGAIWQCLGWLYAKLKLRPQTSQEAQAIYAPHGSLMIFGPAYFEAGLDFNYPIFLYGEEMWVAENCIQKNLKIWYQPQLQALHAEHGSLGIIPSRRVWKAHRDSNRYILQKFFGQLE
jgi:hypothetical protein